MLECVALGTHTLPQQVLTCMRCSLAPCLTAAPTQAAALQLMTYGLENDDLTVVEEQARLGVTAAIIDDVEAALARQPSIAAA